MQNFDKVPQSLKSLHNWVLWKLEIRDGIETKVPYQINGHRASHSNPETWSTFERVYQEFLAGGYSGIGFVFNKESNLCGIDIDKCRNPTTGEIEDRAIKIIKALSSYTEISPSGTGVHIIANGTWPYPKNRKDRIEVYNHNRYFTVTGNALPASMVNVQERQSELEWLYKNYLNGDKPHQANQAHRALGGVPESLQQSDTDILRKCRKAKNGAKFSALYDYGDTSAYEGDDSRADSALCCLIAFYTQDFNQIDRLFRGSRLYRSKWEREDYRQRTIMHALETVTDTYKGSNMIKAETEFGDETGVQTKSTITDIDFSGLSVGNWIEEPETPSDDIITDMFEKGDKVAVIGRSKSRKSFFIQQLGFCVASGRSFLEFHTPKARKVLLIQYEVKKKKYHTRCIKLAHRMGFSREELNNLIVVNGRGHPNPLQLLEKSVEQYRPELTIVDPLYKLINGDENKSEELKPIFKCFDSICERFETTVLYLHHDKKGLTGREDNTDRGAGSGITARDYDTGVILSKHETDEDSLVLEFEFRNYPPKEKSTIQFLNGAFVPSEAEPTKRTINSKPPSPKLPQLIDRAKKMLTAEYQAGRHSMEMAAFNIKLTDAGVSSRKVTAVKEELEQMGLITFEKRKAQKGRSSITVFILDTIMGKNETLFPEMHDGF